MRVGEVKRRSLSACGKNEERSRSEFTCEKNIDFESSVSSMKASTRAEYCAHEG
jgi:hypothetical protein